MASSVFYSPACCSNGPVFGTRVSGFKPRSRGSCIRATTESPPSYKSISTPKSEQDSVTESAINKNEELTPLEQHVAFFDKDGDGKVYPVETFNGFRALGFDPLFSAFNTLAINGALSYPTLESWIPDLLFPIHIKNIHKCKHGSDSGVYDHDGNFVEENFEKMFSKFARTHPDKMTFDEIIYMTRRNRDVYDFFGWIAAQVEWRPAFDIMKDEDGFASKEDIRALYDGSLFYKVEKRRRGAMEVKQDH